MADEIVTQCPRFFCMCMTPDMCKTPPSMVPVPYPITAEFVMGTGFSSTTKSFHFPVAKEKATQIPMVIGDQPGVGLGVKSNTVMAEVTIKRCSTNFTVDKEKVVRVGDMVEMNHGNTIGKIYDRVPLPSPSANSPVDAKVIRSKGRPQKNANMLKQAGKGPGALKQLLANTAKQAAALAQGPYAQAAMSVGGTAMSLKEGFSKPASEGTKPPASPLDMVIPPSAMAFTPGKLGGA